MTKMKYKYPYKPRKRAPASTKELRFKHKLGLTLSPIDICFRRSIITQSMHQAANYFIYLHSKRFGAMHLKDKVSYIYEFDKYKASRNSNSEIDDNELYKQIIAVLQQQGCYKLILNTCVYEKFPEFLKTTRNSANKYKDFQVLMLGLDCLVDVFEKKMMQNFGI